MSRLNENAAFWSLLPLPHSRTSALLAEPARSPIFAHNSQTDAPASAAAEVHGYLIGRFCTHPKRPWRPESMNGARHAEDMDGLEARHLCRSSTQRISSAVSTG